MEKNKTTYINENLWILDIQEKERQRIGRDLHDYSLQNLTYLIHKLEIASIHIDKDPIEAKLDIALITSKLRETIDDIRNTIYDLRPMCFDDLGFRDALDGLKINLQENSSMKISFFVHMITIHNSLLLITLFRIIQEGCYNSIKHSKGTKLDFSIEEKNNKILIYIKDDGIGFDHEIVHNNDAHFGLSILKERVLLLSGKIEINSNKKGTKIQIEIPTDNGRNIIT